MPEERLPWRCANSTSVSKADRNIPRDAAISFKESQNASSRLILVLWPDRTTDRFITRDFMTHSDVRITRRTLLIATHTVRSQRKSAKTLTLDFGTDFPVRTFPPPETT